MRKKTPKTFEESLRFYDNSTKKPSRNTKSVYIGQAMNDSNINSLSNVNKKRKYHEILSKSEEKHIETNDRSVISLNSTTKKIHKNCDISINSLKKPIINPKNSNKKTPSVNLNNNNIEHQTKSPMVLLNSENKLTNISEIENNQNQNSTFLSNLNELDLDFPLDLSNTLHSASKKSRNYQKFLIGQEIDGGGSFFKYSIQKANRLQKKLFGVSSVITPVRSSKRLKTQKEEEVITVDLIKKEKELVYVPNRLEQEYEPIDENSLLLKAYLHKNP